MVVILLEAYILNYSHLFLLASEIKIPCNKKWKAHIAFRFLFFLVCYFVCLTRFVNCKV